MSEHSTPSTLDLKQDYFNHCCSRAIVICDDESRRYALADVLVKSTEEGKTITKEAAKEIARFLRIPTKREKGRPFVSVIEKARRVGHIAILVEHFKLKSSYAAELVAAAHSTNPDKPLDPSGFRALWKSRDSLWRRASVETQGMFSFRPTGCSDVDGQFYFNESELALLFSASLKTELEKQMRDFFNYRS